VGGSDCERIGGGILAQPASALSSIAYLVAGMLLVQRALARRSGAVSVTYGVLVVWVGVGSAAYHGPMPSWARFAHDVSIAAVLAFVIGNDAARARRAPPRVGFMTFGMLLAASATLLAVTPDADNGLDAALVAAAVVGEVTCARSTPGGAASARWPWLVVGVALTVGVTLNALGRTDGPLCDPASPVQLHAAWHVITAFVLWLYGAAVLEPREHGRRIIRA
jgi:hypothetical protein